jgi:hypothetical protein
VPTKWHSNDWTKFPHGNTEVALREIILNHTVAGGTVTDAYFIAHAKSPSNHYVQTLASSGMKHCIKLKSNTPKDVVQWVKQECNSWHKGVKYTFGQQLEDVVEAANRWSTHARTNGWTTGSLPESGRHYFPKFH